MKAPRIPRCASGILLVAWLGCSGPLYDFGLPGRGTTFHLPPAVALSPDPVVQSWAAYNLAKSTCQLQMGGPRPAANSSFSCELRPRQVLVKRWAARNASLYEPKAPSQNEEGDEYLDLLVEIDEAGFLAEYVWVYLGKRGWRRPDSLRLDAFEAWRRERLCWHRAKTRRIGWWADSGRTPSGSPDL